MENESLTEKEEEVQPAEPAPGEGIEEVQSPAAGTSTDEGIEPKPKSWLQKSWPWLTAVLVSLLAGAALVFFLLYLPASSALRQSQGELTSVTGELEQAAAKAEGLQSDLSSAEERIESLQTELESVQLTLAISRLQANISYARLALINKDALTARQELSDAESNLAELSRLLGDSETSSALAARLRTIRTNLTSDPSRALEEMRTLGENLARLKNR